MVKHSQAIRRLLPTNCLSVFDHFVRLVLKRLIHVKSFHQLRKLLSNDEYVCEYFYSLVNHLIMNLDQLINLVIDNIFRKYAPNWRTEF